MATKKPKNILIAPLDWGLGHTTRCVPLIRYLLASGHNPIVAGKASQLSFINGLFTNIQTVHLDGYNITYSTLNRYLQAGIMTQLPRILGTIREEHAWLHKIAGELQLDGIISDNRYGLYHSGIPSVIITHQLRVQTGLGNIADTTLQKLHYKYLDKFGATWVADTHQPPGLAGVLSHPDILPKQTSYLGLLSAFENTGVYNTDAATLLVLISGPEPQRSVLSKILWQQVLPHNGDVVFVEGSETAEAPQSIPAHITWHNRIAGERLHSLLQNAEMVICRSGYSTLMDLIALRKKAILIPTPGQTEQEYLGKLLAEQGLFYATPQAGFDLSSALSMAAKFPYNQSMLQDHFGNYKPVIDDWLATL